MSGGGSYRLGRSLRREKGGMYEYVGTRIRVDHAADKSQRYMHMHMHMLSVRPVSGPYQAYIHTTPLVIPYRISPLIRYSASRQSFAVLAPSCSW